MTDTKTLILTGADVRELLGLDDCIDTVERVFGMLGRGEVPDPSVLGVHVSGGGFHIKAACAQLGRSYFAAKTNANFPDNPRQRGLPSIQGVIVLSDARDGRPLAILDSMEITTLRTGAATGVAARHLARSDSTVATIVGCGIQGRAQLRSIMAVLPGLSRIWAIDRDPTVAQGFAREMGEELGVPIQVTDDLSAAVRDSDVCVTCTPARRALLGPADVRPGTFVAAVGADNPEKNEVDPLLMQASTVIVDVLEQCAEIGELHHAVSAGVMSAGAVAGQLGDVVAGTVQCRANSSDTVIFDSTGTALQDVAAAALVYERAVAGGHDRAVRLGA